VAPAFYALGRTRVPLIASVSAVAVNLLWNWLTFHRFGHVGLAVGTSLAATVNLGVLLVAFQIQVRGFFTRELFGALARIALASALMGAAVWFLSAKLEPLDLPRLLGWVIKVFIPVTAGAGVYFLTARVLGLAEASALLRRLR
jgi:putative peptidoglycan lipid II flippase